MTYGDQLELIRRHHERAPVETVPIARDLGLEVYRIKPGSWPNDLSGLIKKDEKGKYNIYVNGDHHVHRRRFTIAHEIAHFILHKDKIGDGLADDMLFRSGLNNLIEREANSLAAHILMPWSLLEAEIRKGVSTIDELAEIFNVSKSSMSIRMGVPFET